MFKNLLVRLHLINIARSVQQRIRILFLIPRYLSIYLSIYSELIKEEYTIKIVNNDIGIKKLLDRKGIYHPTSNYKFSHMNGTKKEWCAFIIEYNKEEYIIPFMYSNNKITLLINYIQLPELVFKIVFKSLIDKYLLFSFETQRNYNEYSIPWLKKIVFEDGYLVNLDNGFDNYYESLGKKTRWNTKYYFKRLKKDFNNIDIMYFKQGEFTYKLLLKFISLVGQRYDEKYWYHLKDKGTFEEFTNDIVAIVFFVDKEPISFNIFYKGKNNLAFIGNTFNEKYSKYSLGFLTTFYSIQKLYENGYKNIILGPGSFGYKNRLANGIEKLYWYTIK